MPIGSFASTSNQSATAPLRVSTLTTLPLQPLQVSNLPDTTARDRPQEPNGAGSLYINIPLHGAMPLELQEMEKELNGHRLKTVELTRLIRDGFGRTPLGRTMSTQLIVDFVTAALPNPSEKNQREVWQDVIQDALLLPFEQWHARHANANKLLALPKNAFESLKKLRDLLRKDAPAGKDWSVVLPEPKYTRRGELIISLSRRVTVEAAEPVRTGSGGPWAAAALGVLAAAGLPVAQGARGFGEENSAGVPLLPQRLVDIVTPMVGHLAPVVSLGMRYPRALRVLAGTGMATAVGTTLYMLSGRSLDHGASVGFAPPLALAGIAPDILANVTTEVRHGDPLLSAEERARRAVRALGPAAEDVRRLWQIERHGRSDHLPFVDPGPDIEFGGWLIKQVFGEPVPPGGVDMTWSTWTLSNGLRVILTPGKGDKASVQLRFGDGSGIERNGQRGAVHFAEHLWFRRNPANGPSFDNLYMAAGVRDNAYTTHDATVYFTEGPVEALPLILFEKGFRLAHATDRLLPAHFEIERKVVQNEVELRDTTASRAHGVLARAMYPLGHPYRTSVGGRPKDLLSLQASDMENFTRARQRPNLATLVISGEVDEDQIRELVSEYFADIEPGNTFPKRTPNVQPRPRNTNDEITDSVATPRLYRAWNLPQDGDVQLPALMLCARVLTRRLNDALEESIAFGAAYVEPRELGSQFHVVLSLRADADQAQVKQMLDSVSTTFLADGPTEDELDGARRALLSANAWREASSDGIASAVVHCVDKGLDPDCVNVDVQAWHDATPDTVKRAANDWLSRGSHTLVVTPGRRPAHPLKRPGPTLNVPWDAGVRDPRLKPVMKAVDRTVPPPVPLPGPVNFPAVSRKELPNGLPLVLAPMTKSQKARVVFTFDGGRTGDLDPDIGLGTAKAALRVVTQRTASLEQVALKKKLDDLELTVAARSKPGYSTITLEGPRAKLAEGMRMVADMLTDTRFPADLLDQPRHSARDVMQSFANDPDLRSRVLIRRLVLGEQHPYAVDPRGEGTEASLEAMTPEKLKLWAERYLNPSNATIVAVGSFDPAELFTGVAQAFGAVDGVRERSRTNVPVPARSVHPGMHLFPIVDRGQQSHLLLGYPVPCDGSTSDVLHECVDRIIQHRVKEKLRNEQGLVYRVDSLATSTRGVRMGGFAMAVNDAHGLDALATARRVVSDLLDGRRPVTQEELNLHLLYLRRDLATRFEDPLEVESALVSVVDLRAQDTYADDAAGVMESLTSDEVNRAMGRMVTTHLTWILAGPAARAVDSTVSSETDEQADEDSERRLQLTAMGLSQFTEVDPATGARTVHQL